MTSDNRSKSERVLLPKISPLHITADVEYHWEDGLKVIDKATVVRVDLCSHPTEPLDHPIHDAETQGKRESNDHSV